MYNIFHVVTDLVEKKVRTEVNHTEQLCKPLCKMNYLYNIIIIRVYNTDSTSMITKPQTSTQNIPIKPMMNAVGEFCRILKEDKGHYAYLNYEKMGWLEEKIYHN